MRNHGRRFLQLRVVAEREEREEREKKMTGLSFSGMGLALPVLEG